jgi:hypothetical protein
MKLEPERVKANEALPGAAEVGEMEDSTGKGFGCGLMMNTMVFERPLSVVPECGFNVLTRAVPTAVMSDLSTVAVNVRTLLLASVVTVVGIVLPFHCTTVFATKPAPKRFIMKVSPPALAFEGDRELSLAPVGD